MAVGTLGRSIIFEVSDERVMTFRDFGREVSGRWAAHEVMQAKPRSEFLGAGMQSVSLTITLSATLGVRPRAVLQAVEAMVETGAAEYLVIGTGPVGRNPFKLVGASETWDAVYNRGELAKATLTITLEEYT